jgi:hypothetical protein
MDNVNVIIEDTPACTCLSKVAWLSGWGVARTFNEALQLFYTNKVDVVIIDIFLMALGDSHMQTSCECQSCLCFNQLKWRKWKEQNSASI